MARFLCKCGATLSNSESPNDTELHVFTDREWDEIINLDILDPLSMPSPNYDVWQCMECGRIHVFSDNEVIKTYIVEI